MSSADLGLDSFTPEQRTWLVGLLDLVLSLHEQLARARKDLNALDLALTRKGAVAASEVDAARHEVDAAWTVEEVANPRLQGFEVLRRLVDEWRREAERR